MPLLAALVAFAVPSGLLVVSAGVLYGGLTGVGVVLLGQVLGLTINWRLCRGLLRPRMQRWLERRPRGRWLERLLQRPASLRLLVLLRLAALPMNLVNVGCALGPTPLRRYALGSLVLVPRFALLVQLGALGASAGRSGLVSLPWLLRGLTALATVALVVLLLRGRRTG